MSGASLVADPRNHGDDSDCQDNHAGSQFIPTEADLVVGPLCYIRHLGQKYPWTMDTYPPCL